MKNKEKEEMRKDRKLHQANVRQAKKDRDDAKAKGIPAPLKSVENLYYKLKCARFKLANLKDKKGQIVFLGDSLTDLCKLKRFYKEVKKKNKLKLYNRGISGDKTDGVIERMDNSAIKLAPKKLVLLIGVNDIFAKWDSEVTITNFEQILDILNKELPKTKVFICSLTPICQTVINKEFIDIDYATKKIMDINKEYEKIAGKRSIDFINLFDALKDDDNHIRRELTIDGVHFNKYAYKIISKIVTPYLIKK